MTEYWSHGWRLDQFVPHQCGWEYIQVGLYCYIILGLADICRKMDSKLEHNYNMNLLMHTVYLHVFQNVGQVFT